MKQDSYRNFSNLCCRTCKYVLWVEEWEEDSKPYCWLHNSEWVSEFGCCDGYESSKENT